VVVTETGSMDDATTPSPQNSARTHADLPIALQSVAPNLQKSSEKSTSVFLRLVREKSRAPLAGAAPCRLPAGRGARSLASSHDHDAAMGAWPPDRRQ